MKTDNMEIDVDKLIKEVSDLDGGNYTWEGIVEVAEKYNITRRALQFHITMNNHLIINRE